MSDGVQHSRAVEIRDYAIIGDMRTAALVSKRGSIDWLCFPRFDSPAVLCRLLDVDRGGFFEIRPRAAFESERAYVDETNVLATTFTTAMGRVRLLDFMPVAGDDADAGSAIVRVIEGLAGTVEIEVRLRPTFDFARSRVRHTVSTGVVDASSNGACLRLRCPGAPRVEQDGTIRARLTMRGGERVTVALSCVASESSAPPTARGGIGEHALEQTLAFWRSWAARCTYDGAYRALVLRSALTLKLLTYAATGALVAAPTTSLPEQLGGVRNWDYRFSWLRDSSLVLDALMRLGYHDEAMAFWRWLESLCIGCCSDVRIMYTVTGDTPPPEQQLDGLSGFCDSMPVRIGNAAAFQRQLDVYGDILDAAYLCMDRMGVAHPDLAPLLGYLADVAAASWQEPDQGIWEVRTGPRHFLHSKLSCWIALDRAIRLAGRGWLAGDVRQWRRVRSDLRRAILTRAHDPKSGAFTQSLDGDALDATALLVPRSGLLPPDDPRVLSTIDAIRDRLTSNGLVYRYLNDDGVPGTDATFAICSFWMVDALVGSGRIEEGRRLFDKVVPYANDVGLLAEEIDPVTRMLLGNFPQGFSHLGLVRSALALEDLVPRS